MKSKVCNKCNERKNLDEFDKQKDGRFGRRSKCKKCRQKYRKGLKPIKEEGLPKKKTCTICGKNKSLSSFYRKKYNRTDGRQSSCKSCEKEIKKNKNPITDINLSGKKICTKCSKNKKLSKFFKSKDNRTDGRRSWCKSCVTSFQKAYNKTLEHVKGVDLSKNKTCTNCGKNKKLSEFRKNKRNRSDGRRSNCKSCEYKYRRSRYHKNADYKFRSILRKNTRRAFKNKLKDSKTVELLGSSFEEAKEYLMSKSPKGFE